MVVVASKAGVVSSLYVGAPHAVVAPLTLGVPEYEYEQSCQNV
jgi:hypothetical protein